MNLPFVSAGYFCANASITSGPHGLPDPSFLRDPRHHVNDKDGELFKGDDDD